MENKCPFKSTEIEQFLDFSKKIRYKIHRITLESSWNLNILKHLSDLKKYHSKCFMNLKNNQEFIDYFSMNSELIKVLDSWASTCKRIDEVLNLNRKIVSENIFNRLKKDLKKYGKNLFMLEKQIHSYYYLLIKNN